MPTSAGAAGLTDGVCDVDLIHAQREHTLNPFRPDGDTVHTLKTIGAGAHLLRVGAAAPVHRAVWVSAAALTVEVAPVAGEAAERHADHLAGIARLLPLLAVARLGGVTDGGGGGLDVEVALVGALVLVRLAAVLGDVLARQREAKGGEGRLASRLGVPDLELDAAWQGRNEAQESDDEWRRTKAAAEIAMTTTTTITT